MRAALKMMSAAVLLAAVLGTGCGNESTAGTGPALIEQVDVAGLSQAQLYYAPAVSDRLLTADQLGDTNGAIPVRLEFLGNYAVAWYAPHGEPVFSHDTVIAAFPIAETAAALATVDGQMVGVTPYFGETHPATILAPAHSTGGLGSPSGGLTGTTAIGGTTHATTTTTGLPNAGTFLRWGSLIRENPGLVSAIGAYHPGCG